MLRWDPLRTFGDANGRGRNLIILNYEKKTVHFVKFFFRFKKTFFEIIEQILIVWCVESSFFVVAFFVLFGANSGETDIFEVSHNL